MYRRVFSAAVILILVLAIFTGCTPKEATPTETPVPTVTLSPSLKPTPEPMPAPTVTPPPTGTVAAIPPPTPTPEPTAEPTPPPPQETSSAGTPLTVLSIIGGDVYVLRAGTDTWEPAEIGMTLQPGDSIKAGSGSNAEITFFDGSTIELEESTVVGVSELGIADTGTTTIRLTQELGKTISRVKKLADPASRYEIETPAAIAAVRGSIMEVTVEEDGKTIVANIEGDIRVIVDGKEYIIHEGYQRTIIPGYPPGPEVPIGIPPYEPEGGSGGGGGGSSRVLTARIEVTVTAEPPVAHIGDTITYTYYLQNTGDLSLNNIEVDNDITGNAVYQSGDTNGNSILDRGETWVFTSMHVASEEDPSPLVATTTVSAMTFTSVTVIDTEIVTTSIIPKEPGIAITKTAEPSRVHDGDEITYTYTVTNTGDLPLLIVSLTDDMVNEISYISGDNNENGLLDLEETWVFTAVHIASAADPETLVNYAEVSGMDEQERIVTDTDSANVSILRPGIALAKTADPPEVDEGDNITYTFTVTNTGNTPLSGVSVSDNMVDEITYVGGDENVNELLDTDETWIFTGTYTTSADDPDVLKNTAEVSGRDTLEQSVSDTDSASVALIRPFVPMPGIALAKTAEPARVHEGDEITYTFTVTNTGNMPLSNVAVSDNMVDEITYVGGDENVNELLDTDETWVFTASYIASDSDPDVLENTAEVSGMDTLEQSVSDTDSASVAILRPGITLAKTANPLQAHVGDEITYTFTVTNAGNTPLSNISVSDNMVDEITYFSGDENANKILDTDETWVFTASYIASDSDPDVLENTAEVSGMDTLERTVTASDSVSVAILKPGIDLIKNASPHFVEEGDDIYYVYHITNTGNTPLADISVTDNRLELESITYWKGDDDEDGLLDVEEIWKFWATYTTGPDDPSPLENTAEASGTDALGQTVTDVDSESVTILR
jgi:uncharacterized repeat protein (TIGR01451 family)